MSKKKAGIVCSVTAIIAIITTQYTDQVKVSKQGLELIGNSESCRRDPYYCPANVLTVGVGSTTGKIDPSKIYSDSEIAERWVKDIMSAQDCVEKYANGRKMKQGQYDTTVSITFNAGCGRMQKSTMFKLFRQGEFIKGCNEFPRWVYGGGKVLPGLVIRREAEKKLCLSS